MPFGQVSGVIRQRPARQLDRLVSWVMDFDPIGGIPVAVSQRAAGGHKLRDHQIAGQQMAVLQDFELPGQKMARTKRPGGNERLAGVLPRRTVFGWTTVASRAPMPRVALTTSLPTADAHLRCAPRGCQENMAHPKNCDTNPKRQRVEIGSREISSATAVIR